LASLEFLRVFFKWGGGLEVDPGLLDDGAEEAAGWEGLSGVDAARKGGVGGDMLLPFVIGVGFGQGAADGGIFRGWH
jgi:hypothetical protein